MKHSMKKIISLVLVLAMSLAVSVPGFAAEKQAVQKSQVQTISSKAMASGKTYGPWFGSSSDSFNTAGVYTASVVVLKALTDGLSAIVETSNARIIATALASGMAQVPLYTDDYTYGTVTKRYREVYVSGVFAYFQTEVTTKAYVVKNGKTTSLGTDVKIFEGNGPLLYNV